MSPRFSVIEISLKKKVLCLFFFFGCKTQDPALAICSLCRVTLEYYDYLLKSEKLCLIKTIFQANEDSEYKISRTEIHNTKKQIDKDITTNLQTFLFRARDFGCFSTVLPLKVVFYFFCLAMAECLESPIYAFC